MAKHTSRKANLKTTTAPASEPVVHDMAGTIVFVDTDGDVLSRPKDIVENYEQFFQDEYGVELDLPQDKAFATIRQIPGDERGADKEIIRKARLDALKQAMDRAASGETFDAPSIRSPMGAVASKFGDLVGADADANTILEQAADAQETRLGAPIRLAYIMAKKWGAKMTNEGYIDSVTVAVGKDGALVPIHRAWPVPGSTDKDKPAGYKADKYKWEDSNGVKRKGHFVGDIVRSFRTGADLQDRMNDLKNLAIQGFDHAKIKRKEYIDDYSDNNEARITELDRLSQRWTQMIGAANGAIAFLQVSTWLHTEFPDVQWGFPLAKGFNGNDPEHIAKVAKMRKPIQFSRKDAGRTPSSVPPWTLSQFNALQLPSKKYNGQIKLAVAKLNGATLGAVLKTVERVKKGDGPTKQGGDKDKTGKKFGTPSTGEIESFTAGLMTGLDERRDSDLAMAYRNKIMLWLGMEGKDADDRLLTFSNAVDELLVIRAPFKDRIERVANDQMKAHAEAKRLEAEATKAKLAATG